MPKGDDKKDIKVEDRRSSSAAKEETPPETDEKAPEEQAPEEQKLEEDRVADEEVEMADGPFLEVDFSAFIFSLFSSALIQLGDMDDPITGKPGKNIAAAKQTIDIIDILKEKTKGNLDEEEDKLLTNASAELKWKYLDSVKQKG